MRGQGNFFVCVIAIVAAFVLPTGAADGGMAGQSFSSTPGSGASSLQPDWNRDIIRECAYAIAGHEHFNVLYTCFCLKAGAETPGEQESADAQCEQAKSYYSR